MPKWIYLYVDDVRPAPDGWERARTVTEAIRALDGPLYVEKLSLDHDIMCVYGDDGEGHPYNEHTSPETYEPIARFVRMMKFMDRPVTVVIHTANDPAGQVMMDILKDQVYELVRCRDSDTELKELVYR